MQLLVDHCPTPMWLSFCSFFGSYNVTPVNHYLISLLSKLGESKVNVEKYGRAAAWLCYDSESREGLDPCGLSPKLYAMLCQLEIEFFFSKHLFIYTYIYI